MGVEPVGHAVVVAVLVPHAEESGGGLREGRGLARRVLDPRRGLDVKFFPAK